MKLYDAFLSPYSARVRVALYAKGLTAEIVDPFEALSPDAFKDKTPLAKVPAIETEDGWVLPESETITEYLEEAYPEPRLLPGDARQRARVRLIARVAELYVLEPLTTLFGQIDPAVRDAATVKKSFEDVKKGLIWLESYLSGAPYAVGDGLTLADCALLPVIFFVRKMPQFFGKTGCMLDPHPNLTSYWKGLAGDPHAGRVLTEMEEALQRFQ